MASKRKKTPKRLRTLRKLTQDQYLVFRSIKTGKITKWRKGRNLFAEVRSKKSKKIQGYLNSFSGRGKKRKIKPRRFSRGAVSIAKRRVKTGLRIQDQSTFQVNLLEKVFPQFKSNGRRQVQKIIDTIKQDGLVNISVSAKFSDDTETKSLFHAYDFRDTNFDRLATELAINFLNSVRAEGIRTSPKKHDPENRSERLRQRKMKYKKCLVKFVYGGFNEETT